MSYLIRLRGTTNGIVDLAGNTWTNNGVTVGNTELVTGGHAMIFANNGYLSISGNSKFNIAAGQDFTISVKVKTAMGTAYPLIIGVQPDGSESFQNHQPCLSATLGGTPTPYYYYANNAYISSSSQYTIGAVTHIAVVRKNGTIKMYLDGTSVATVSNNDIQDFGRKDIGVGYDLLANISHFSGEMDDLCILDEAVWDSNFTPPTGYLMLRDVIYLSGQEAWGIDGNGTFAKLSANYNSMTDAQKITMLNATDGKVPTITQLKTLSMPIKAVSYSDDNTQPTCTVIAIPESQTITQKDRINLVQYNKITSVAITDTTSGDGIIKLAVTKDNTTYQVYDTTNLEWKIIDINDISTDGMSVSDIESLTSAEWALLDCMNTGLGFAYYLEMQNTTDSASIADIGINVEVIGPLKSLVKGTDYDYEYVGIDVLQVKLYKNGDFRINYNPG